MSKQAPPIGVQITLANGHVMDYQSVMGDMISLYKRATQVKQPHKAQEEVLYYTVIVVPGEENGNGSQA
jgi:hypothetical protein